MIIEEILNDEYDRILLRTPKTEKAEEAEAIVDMLIVQLTRFTWLGYSDKQKIIARLLNVLPNKH